MGLSSSAPRILPAGVAVGTLHDDNEMNGPGGGGEGGEKKGERNGCEKKLVIKKFSWCLVTVYQFPEGVKSMV